MVVNSDFDSDTTLVVFGVYQNVMSVIDIPRRIVLTDGNSILL